MADMKEITYNGKTYYYQEDATLSSSYNPRVSYFGIKVYITPGTENRKPFDEAKVKEFGIPSDLLGELFSLGEIKASVSNVDATSISNEDGYAQLAPLLKSLDEIPIVVYKNEDNFKRIYEKFFAKSTGGTDFACRLWVNLPGQYTDSETNLPIDSFYMNGYISSYTFGKGTADDVQKIEFSFQPVGAVKYWDGTFQTLSDTNSSSL